MLKYRNKPKFIFLFYFIFGSKKIKIYLTIKNINIRYVRK